MDSIKATTTTISITKEQGFTQAQLIAILKAALRPNHSNTVDSTATSVAFNFFFTNGRRKGGS